MQILPQQLFSLREAALLLFDLLARAGCEGIFASLQTTREHMVLYSRSEHNTLDFPNHNLPYVSLKLDQSLYAYPSAHTIYIEEANSSPELQRLLHAFNKKSLLLTVCLLPYQNNMIILGSESDNIACESISQSDTKTIEEKSSLQSATQLLSHLVLLEQASITDELTELYNKRFLSYLKTSSNKEESSIVFIDFNNFKHINDTYGHAAGDAVLKESAKRLKFQLRKSDQLIRYGGDEFIIYIQKKMYESDLEALMQKLQAALKAPIPFGEGLEIHVSASFGFSIGNQLTDTIEQLIEKADEDMYEEKHKKEL